jgi:hypothetical protein
LSSIQFTVEQYRTYLIWLTKNNVTEHGMEGCLSTQHATEYGEQNDDDLEEEPRK